MGNSLIAQLIDPDFIRDFDHLSDVVKNAEKASIDFFFFGGSLITGVSDFDVLKALKKLSRLPVVLFPSSPAHIDHNADALLFLSLLSGRNPEYLIGHHVAAAPILKNSPLEIIATAYLLICCGTTTTAEYMSNSQPIPYLKSEIAAATALAGEMLGMQAVYLDGGSGAAKCISTDMVRTVRSWVNLPIIVGGGIKTSKDAEDLISAGADLLVIGNGAQEKPELLMELASKIKCHGTGSNI